MIIEYILAVLFGIVGIFYFISGSVFSTAWSWLGKILGSTDVMLSEAALDNINALGNITLPLVNPVLSTYVKSNVLRGIWMILIGLLLMLTAAMLPSYSLIGLIFVIAFSVLEICLGIFFYWKHDGYKKGLQYIIIYSIMMIVAIVGLIL